MIWFDLKLNIETRFDNNLKSNVSPVQGKRWQHDCLAKVQVVHLTVDSRLLSINAWQNNRHARKCQVNLTSRTEPVSGLEIWISCPMAHLPLRCPWVIRVCVSCQALFDAKKMKNHCMWVPHPKLTNSRPTALATLSITQGELQRPMSSFHPLPANCLETWDQGVGPRKLIQPCSASLQSTDC